MFVYTLTYVLAFVSTFFATKFKVSFDKEKKKKDLLFFILLGVLTFIILALPVCLRYGIGYDYLDIDTPVLQDLQNGLYQDKYRKIEFIPYILATQIVKHELPFELFFAIYGLLTNLNFVLAIYLSKKNDFMTKLFVFLFYALYVSQMNQMRQGLGISMGVLAFSILINYKDKKIGIVLAYLIALLSIGAHFTELFNLVILTIYLLVDKFGNKLSKNKLMVLTFGVIFVIPVLFIALKYTISYIPFIKRYAYFFTSEDTSVLDNTLKSLDPNSGFTKFLNDFILIAGSFGIFIVCYANFIFMLIYFENTDDNNMKAIFLYLGLSIALSISTMLMKNLMLADRTRTLLYGLDIFIFPYILSKLDGKAKLAYKYIVGGLMIALTVGTVIPAKVYPYRTFIAKDYLIY